MDNASAPKPAHKQHPAFPCESGPYLNPGLTKREAYALVAMHGLISGCYSGNNFGFTMEGNVLAAVDYADALLAELAKGGTDGK